MSGCPVYRSPCPVHGIVHGAEAGELRNALERLLEDGEHTDEWPDDIRRILDCVPAHDSLAHAGARSRREKLVELTAMTQEMGGYPELDRPVIADQEHELQRCLYVGCSDPATHEDAVIDIDSGELCWTVCCFRHASPDAVPWAGPGTGRLHP